MKFVLILDKKGYHAGEMVSGRVEAWRNRTFTTYGCIVELIGSEQHRKKLGSSAAFEVKSKVFLSQKVRLGREGVSKDTNKYYKLAAGEHIWPFQFQLPNKLPASFDHPSGNCKIIYEIKAYMQIPGDRDGTAAVSFRLLSDPVSRTLKNVEADGEKSFVGQRKEPIYARARLQKDTFIPGEKVKIQLFVDNASRKVVTHVDIDVIRRWRYGKTRDEQVLSSSRVQGTPFPLGPRAMFESVIATTLPGELQQSVVGDTLGCTYVLHVHVVTAGVVTGNLKIVVPFAVVEQFRSRTNSNHSSPSHSNSNSPALKHATKPLPSPTAPQLTPSNSIRPPPSYTQATQSTPSTTSSSTSSHYGNLTVTPPSAPFETINSSAPVAFAAPGTFSKKEPNLIEQQPPGYGVIPPTPQITPPPPFLAPGTFSKRNDKDEIEKWMADAVIIEKNNDNNNTLKQPIRTRSRSRSPISRKPAQFFKPSAPNLTLKQEAKEDKH